MPRFVAGDDVMCVCGDSDRLVEGRTYVVVNGDDTYVKLANNPGLWGCDRFVRTSPIRVITRKEIVPGKYGRIDVMIDPDDGGSFIKGLGFMRSSELREASRIFLELADALDDKS